MTDAQIKHMVVRFLNWQLPTISNVPLDASQAETLVRYMIEKLPTETNDDKQENATLRPPAEHAEHAMHWLAIGRTFEVYEWTGTHWLAFGDALPHTPGKLSAMGLRYVGPAVPPIEQRVESGDPLQNYIDRHTEEGRVAQRIGLTIADNPYLRGSLEAITWQKGYEGTA